LISLAADFLGRLQGQAGVVVRLCILAAHQKSLRKYGIGLGQVLSPTYILTDRQRFFCKANGFFVIPLITTDGGDVDQ